MKNAEMKVVPIGGDVITASVDPIEFSATFDRMLFLDHDGAYDGEHISGSGEFGDLSYGIVLYWKDQTSAPWTQFTESVASENVGGLTVYRDPTHITTTDALIAELMNDDYNNTYNGTYTFNGETLRFELIN